MTGTTIQMINQKPLFHSTSAMSPPKDLVYKVAWREILLIFWTLKWHAKFTCRVQVLHYSGRQTVNRLVLVVFIFFRTGCQDCPMTSKAEVWMVFKEVVIQSSDTIYQFYASSIYNFWTLFWQIKILNAMG